LSGAVACVTSEPGRPLRRRCTSVLARLPQGRASVRSPRPLIECGLDRRLEVVLGEPVGDLLAEHGALYVGRSEVDTAPYARVDDLLERVGEAVVASGGAGAVAKRIGARGDATGCAPSNQSGNARIRLSEAVAVPREQRVLPFREAHESAACCARHLRFNPLLKSASSGSHHAERASLESPDGVHVTQREGMRPDRSWRSVGAGSG
jgi:hypothetical protein